MRAITAAKATVVCITTIVILSPCPPKSRASTGETKRTRKAATASTISHMAVMKSKRLASPISINRLHPVLSNKKGHSCTSYRSRGHTIGNCSSQTEIIPQKPKHDIACEKAYSDNQIEQSKSSSTQLRRDKPGNDSSLNCFRNPDVESKNCCKYVGVNEIA